jgi:hypothetical protein
MLSNWQTPKKIRRRKMKKAKKKKKGSHVQLI